MNCKLVAYVWMERVLEDFGRENFKEKFFKEPS
jgi:hypothetical protein